MNFYLARTFTKALERLEQQEAAKAKQAALEFQLDPSQPGFKFHRINNARDRHMWSFRITRDLRAIVHHEGEHFTLCYVDHHDAAYQWAERHTIEQHPVTGQLQIVEIVERTEVVTRQVYDDQTVVLPPFSQASAELLLSVGVPTEWVDWLKAASEEAILTHMERLPQEVQHRVLELLTGGLSTLPEALSLPALPSPPRESQELVQIKDPDELARALNAPWEQWLIFLHPQQRQLVEQRYSGPARVYGSAGTGKTIVALHRIKWLLATYPGAPILLTTYTPALTRDLMERARLLLGEALPPNLHITSYHQWLRGFVAAHIGSFELATDQELRVYIREALAQLPHVPFDERYVASELHAIIDPHDLRTREAYFAVERRGRLRALGKRQKALLWEVFEHVLSRLQAANKRTLNQLSGECAAYLEAHPQARPFGHVVVDETQDYSPAELRALRALVPSQDDDLFLCADTAQRLYGRATSWLKLGIDVRGRSTQLTLNYRTTEQIRAACEALLPGTLEGPTEEEETRLARSLRRGAEISLVGCRSARQEREALWSWLGRMIHERGYSPAQIAILAREASTAMRLGSEAAQQLGVSCGLLGDGETQRPGVAIGSMREAKGLEYRAVAIVACDDQTVPLKAALEEAAADEGDLIDAIEMERNLLYVAGTRARDELFISYVGQPSQFLRLLLSQRPDQAALPRSPSTAPPAEEAEAQGAAPPAQVAPRDEQPAPITQFKISPGRVAQYFSYDCPRYLRYSSAWSPARIAADRVPDEAPPTDYAQAIMDSGYAWEHEVLTTLIPSERLHIAPGEAPLTDRYFNPAQSIEVFKRAQPGTYIYEPTLIAPPRFYQRYGLDRSFITISPCRPDLLEVLADEQRPGHRRLRVIDMKRAAHVQAKHHIQLAFYALILRDVLAEAGIDDLEVELREAAIWLGGHEQPTRRTIDSVYPHLEAFLSQGAHALFSAPVEEVSWHVQPKCEWCPYLERCHAQLEAQDDLSKVARMTHQGKRHLRSHQVTTVAQLEEVFLDRARTAQIIQSNAGLNADRHRLGRRAYALNHGRAVEQGYISAGLTAPSPAEIKLYLTLQREGLGRHIYAAGYHVEAGAQVPQAALRRRQQAPSRVMIAKTPQDAATISRQLIVELYGLLSRIDAYNAGQTRYQDKLSVQCFVYSRAEESLFTELLFEATQAAETQLAATTLLMYFQGPDLILASEHPESYVATPITILLDVIGRTVALPIPISYTLPEVLTALNIKSDYKRDERFHYPLSTVLRPDLIFEAWYQHKPSHIEEISAHLMSYLAAQDAIFEALRQRSSEQLALRMPKFELPYPAQIQDPLRSRLAFLAQYEAAIDCTQKRNQRMIARRAIEDAKEVFALEAIDSASFKLTTPAARLASAELTTWLLAPDSPAGRAAQLQYNDYLERNALFGDSLAQPHLAIVTIKEATRQEDTDETAAIEVRYTRAFASGHEPKAGERYVLYPRFSNMLLDRNVAVIEALDQRPAQDLLHQLLSDELPAPSPLEVPLTVEGLGLTASQQAALVRLSQQRVVALWGPPGTGKTHFLATAILALMEAHRRAGLPYRVLIQTFTHAAGEHLLKKIQARQEAANIFGGRFKLAKCSKWSGEDKPKSITIAPKGKALTPWLDKNAYVIAAGTAWAYDKLHTDYAATYQGVDLVVMDEASQIKLPEAAIGLNLTHHAGRVILAGDHLQLPPIIHGSYPPPADERAPALHRSVFEAISLVGGGSLVCQLEENFRMNQTLTALSAAMLYGPRYRCGDEATAQARLQYHPPQPPAPELIETLLDPSHAISIVLLHDLPPAKDNAPEAKLTAQLTCALRERLNDHLTGQPYASDQDFAKRGVFIVSPHHSQLTRIRQQLNAARAWEVMPLADTVDKMQGQEAAAVIVSYGVSDADYAMMEAEFIYSQSRLNVSITRARHKTILLMPAPLLHASPHILDRDEAAQGLGYMRRVVEWVREAGHEAPIFWYEGRPVEVFSR